MGRIEFKACDSCQDFTIYAGLFALLKGLILDMTLKGRATVPDRALHQESARGGFANAEIAAGTSAVMQAAQHALRDDEDLRLLDPLCAMLQQQETPAHGMMRAFQSTGSLETALCQTYPSLVLEDR